MLQKRTKRSKDKSDDIVEADAQVRSSVQRAVPEANDLMETILLTPLQTVKNLHFAQNFSYYIEKMFRYKRRGQRHQGPAEPCVIAIIVSVQANHINLQSMRLQPSCLHGFSLALQLHLIDI